MQSGEEMRELERCGSRLATWVCMGSNTPQATQMSDVAAVEAKRLEDERQLVADEKTKQRARALAKRRAKAALHGKELDLEDDQPAISKKQDSDVSLAKAKQFVQWRRALGPEALAR